MDHSETEPKSTFLCHQHYTACGTCDRCTSTRVQHGVNMENETYNCGLTQIHTNCQTIEKLSQGQKCLQRTVALMQDQINQRFSLLTDSMKSMSRLQNLNHTAILSSSRDLNREERTWNPGTCSESSSDVSLFGQEGSKFVAERNRVLSLHGKLEFPQMYEMLVKWSTEYMNEHLQVVTKQRLMNVTSEFLQRLLELHGIGSSMTEGDLIKAQNFLQHKDHLMALQMTELFTKVIEAVPDKEWLSYARTKLRLPDSVIREVKRTCQPTREQLYQIHESVQSNNERSLDGQANEASM